MSILDFLSPRKTVEDLRRSIQANMAQNEVLERAHEEREQIFDALTNCLFIFSNESLIRANRAAHEVLDNSQNKESLLEKIRRSRPGPAPKPTDWVEDHVDRKNPLLIRVRSDLPIRLHEQPCRLVTAENLSWLLQEKILLHKSTHSEKLKIARDLHDGLSQILTFISFRAKALEGRMVDENHGEIFSKISKRSQRCAIASAELVRKFEGNSSIDPNFYTT